MCWNESNGRTPECAGMYWIIPVYFGLFRVIPVHCVFDPAGTESHGKHVKL